MIVQLFRTSVKVLVAVDHLGNSWVGSDRIDGLLAEQGVMLPEGWENTPYGHPIIPVPIPKPPSLGDWWRNWYPDGPSHEAHCSEADADAIASSARIAKEHVWTDDDGNDHAEVIRP